MNRTVLSALIAIFLCGVWSAANIVRQDFNAYVCQTILVIIWAVAAITAWKEKK